MALVCYIHLNPVRAGLAKRLERYLHSGHKGYLLNRPAKMIEAGPILKLLGGKKAYEKFVREGMSEKHSEKYYAVEDQRFLGEAGFGEEISRAAGKNKNASLRSRSRRFSKKLLGD